MMVDWTKDQVLALAPDASSAQSGKGLAAPRHWVTLGRSEAAVWGECQGSGSKPYQTRIALAEPAFKCTCPSRKFPCKHALGLFLIFAENRAALAEGEPPGWVAEWLDGRTNRAQKKAERAAEPAKAPDPEQQAKRAAQRAGRVEQGIGELEVWLRDMVRHGLAWAQAQPMSLWKNIAARMVDAQAPGLARQIQEMALVPASGEGWHGRLLGRLARLHLLLQAWRRLDTLDPLLQEDVRAAIGFNTAKETVLAQPEVEDAWLSVAQEVETGEDGLKTQRVWLWGQKTGKAALILSFAHQSAPAFDVHLPPGSLIKGKLCYYPSAWPLRALVKESRMGGECGMRNAKRGEEDRETWGLGDRETEEYRMRNAECGETGNGLGAVETALAEYTGALALNPWIERFPMSLAGVKVVREGKAWFVCDDGKKMLPLRVDEQAGWRMAAVCGGEGSTVFGDWDGERLNAQAMVFEGEFRVVR